MRGRLILLAALLAVSGGPGWARPDLETDVVPLPVVEEPPGPSLAMPSALYLAPRAERDFVEERQELYDALILSQSDGQGIGDPGVVRVVLDLAELHFAHGMAVEGLSLLEPLQEVHLAPAHASRLAALQLALGLIDTRIRPLVPTAAELLSESYTAWPDQVLFLALARIREGSPELAAPYLEGAVARLERFPEAVQAAVLPGLLDAAITAGDWRIARDLAAEFPTHRALAKAPAFHYLLGRAAEAGDDLLIALDSYAKAGEGWDLWAHKARVELVEMGLRAKVMEPAEARAVLELERNLWIGDGDARQVLVRLAGMQAAGGDRIAALEVLGTLLNRYPGTEEAAWARDPAREVIAAVYEDGASGQMPLSPFLLAHRRIAPDFRYDPDFATQAERFADTFRAAGASGIAADEYAAIVDYLSVIRDLGVGEVTAARLDDLRLRQAETLIEGGRYATAGEVLAAGLESDDPELRDRSNVLLARLYSATGADDQVVRTEVFVPSESYLRIKAKAYFDLGDWAGAEQAYDQLFALYGPDIAFSDAVNMVLAAFRNGHAEKAVQLARSFPDLEARPEWAEIAASLNDSAPELLPLKRDTAQERVENAAQTLDRLDPADIPGN